MLLRTWSSQQHWWKTWRQPVSRIHPSSSSTSQPRHMAQSASGGGSARASTAVPSVLHPRCRMDSRRPSSHLLALGLRLGDDRAAAEGDVVEHLHDRRGMAHEGRRQAPELDALPCHRDEVDVAVDPRTVARAFEEAKFAEEVDEQGRVEPRLRDAESIFDREVVGPCLEAPRGHGDVEEVSVEDGLEAPRKGPHDGRLREVRHDGCARQGLAHGVPVDAPPILQQGVDRCQRQEGAQVFHFMLAGVIFCGKDFVPAALKDQIR